MRIYYCGNIAPPATRLSAPVGRSSRLALSSRPWANGEELIQCFFDLEFQHPLEILGRHGTHELVDNVAVAPDDERFWHAVDTPLGRAAIEWGVSGTP